MCPAYRQKPWKTCSLVVLARPHSWTCLHKYEMHRPSEWEGWHRTGSATKALLVASGSKFVHYSMFHECRRALLQAMISLQTKIVTGQRKRKVFNSKLNLFGEKKVSKMKGLLKVFQWNLYAQ